MQSIEQKAAPCPFAQCENSFCLILYSLASPAKLISGLAFYTLRMGQCRSRFLILTHSHAHTHSQTATYRQQIWAYRWRLAGTSWQHFSWTDLCSINVAYINLFSIHMVHPVPVAHCPFVLREEKRLILENGSHIFYFLFAQWNRLTKPQLCHAQIK